MLNRLEMLVLVWMRKMASARMGATDSRMILAVSSFSLGGMELVTITWSNCEFLTFYKAFPVNSPCVAKQETDSAPFSLRTLVASTSVPAVSMISSIIIACFPSTLPTKCIVPISPAAFLCLMIIASEVSFTPTEESSAWKFLALVTPPASGETTTISLRGIFFCSTKQLSATKLASKLSTGTLGPKKPWICPECTSTSMTRSTPTVSSSLATSAAEMGTLGAVFLSCLAYPQQGMTTLIFLADALRIVETIKSNSIKFSFTGGEVDWMMKTSLDRTLSFTQMLTSPSLKRPTLILPRSIFSIQAISLASASLELPVKMTIFFLDRRDRTDILR